MIRTIAIGMLTLMSAGPALGQTRPDPSDLQLVVASGDASVKRAPDRAWVAIAAESHAKTPREAQQMNADAMSSVLTKLKSSGLAQDAIRTTGYDLQPEYDFANNRRTLRGYVARNSIDVRVDELSKLGDVLDIAVGAGATSVSNIRFDLKDRASAEREALRQAVEDARTRAAAVAEGAGMKIEKIVRIEEAGAQPVPLPRQTMVAMRGEALAQPTPVVPGELEIKAAVTLTASVK